MHTASLMGGRLLMDTEQQYHDVSRNGAVVVYSLGNFKLNLSQQSFFAAGSTNTRPAYQTDRFR